MIWFHYKYTLSISITLRCMLIFQIPEFGMLTLQFAEHFLSDSQWATEPNTLPDYYCIRAYATKSIQSMYRRWTLSNKYVNTLSYFTYRKHSYNLCRQETAKKPFTVNLPLRLNGTCEDWDSGTAREYVLVQNHALWEFQQWEASALNRKEKDPLSPFFQINEWKYRNELCISVIVARTMARLIWNQIRMLYKTLYVFERKKSMFGVAAWASIWWKNKYLH